MQLLITDWRLFHSRARGALLAGRQGYVEASVTTYTLQLQWLLPARFC